MISIVIIVKNDREIEDTLYSLSKINRPEKTEIIVIDASKKDILLDIKNKYPKVRWFYYKNSTGKKITIPEQRNMSIMKSKGDIIVFIDAGCSVEEDWLIELIRPMREDNESFVGGLVISKDRKSLHDLNWLGRGNRKYIVECATINMAIKKNIIESVGLFDENFNYSSDTDFSWRAKDLGYKIRYIPSAVMYVNWGNLKQDIKRAIKYGEARLNLHLKHKNRRWKIKNSGLDLFTIYSMFFFIYIISIIPVSLYYHWYFLLVLIPLLKNINKHPVKKLIFDFFWGYGILRELSFQLITNKKMKLLC